MTIECTSLQSVIIGMGFSKKKSATCLKEALSHLLQQHHYSLNGLALPEFKQHDSNVIALQTLIDIPIHYISYEILNSLQPQCSSFSKLSYHHTGLGAVAEACVRAIIHKNDHLLIPKMIYNGISFSIAIKGDPL